MWCRPGTWGGRGLTSMQLISSMAAKGGLWIELDLDLVPARETWNEA